MALATSAVTTAEAAARWETESEPLRRFSASSLSPFQLFRLEGFLMRSWAASMSEERKGAEDRAIVGSGF